MGVKGRRARHHEAAPPAPVCHRDLAPAERDSGVLIGPIEQATVHQGPAGVLAEQVARVAGRAGHGIVGMEIGRVVIGALDTIREPQLAPKGIKRETTGQGPTWARTGSSGTVSARPGALQASAWRRSSVSRETRPMAP